MTRRTPERVNDRGGPASSPSTEATPSLVRRTRQQILDHIRADALQPGDALPSEGAIALRLGVSRVVVREANRELAALGIIEVRSGRPARVAIPDSGIFSTLFEHAVQTRHATVGHVLDVRRSLERRAASLAALRRTELEAKRIVALAAEMRRDIEEPEKVMAHDLALHQAIGEASRNPLFSILSKAFETVTVSTWPVGWRARGGDEARLEIIATHEEIAAAIAAQDLARVDTAVCRHFDETMQALATAGIA